MREMLEQIRKALCVDLHVVALSTSLIIPDIAGAMDSDDGIASGERYRAWYDKWMGSSCHFIDGETCYQMRCSFLHQGSVNLKNTTYKRVIFIHPAVKNLYMHCNVFNDALNLDIGQFCLDMIGRANEWLKTVEKSDKFKKNYDKFMRTYPNGLPPYVVGIPVIS